MDLPKGSSTFEAVLARMREMKSEDADWRSGRTFSLVYPATDDVDEMIAGAADLYLFENALNPFKFPSLQLMEKEVVEMTQGLLHAPERAGGAMTSGGTESIIMSVKTARDKAKATRGIVDPNMVVPRSAHPAFDKGAAYLGVECRRAPLDDGLRADVAAVASLIDDETVLLAGSAPNYPFGVVDPIEELAALAAEREISFHTDSCLGGFLIPFFERLGEEVPPFDFRVEGVTTMSADVHKYGYAPKGASVILHRDGADLQYQSFLFDDWPGGLYGSYAMAGARPALPIAVSWALLNFLGEEGYLGLATVVRETSGRIREGIESTQGLKVFGDPAMSVMAFGSDDFDIFSVGDQMDARGWHLDRQGGPDALHLMVSPKHAEVVEEFLDDLRASVKERRDSEGKEARYA